MKPEPADIDSRILDAAARVFGRTVYHKASVQEIADIAGVGKGSVYRRYPDKLALLFAAGRAMTFELAKLSIAAIDFDKPVESIGRIVEGYFGYCRKNPHFQELMIQIRAATLNNTDAERFIARDGSEHDFREFIVHAQGRGILAAFPPEDVDYMIRSLLYGIVFFKGFPGRPKPSSDLRGSVVRLLSEGLLKKQAAGKGKKER